MSAPPTDERTNEKKKLRCTDLNMTANSNRIAKNKLQIKTRNKTKRVPSQAFHFYNKDAGREFNIFVNG